jgi:hypothetical protein
MVPINDVRFALEEAHRVMALGAVCRIIDADLMRGVNAALIGNEQFFVQPKVRATQSFDMEQTVGYFITQGGARKSFLTADRLADMAAEVGFPHVYAQPSWQTIGPPWIKDLDGRYEESFCIEAVR